MDRLTRFRATHPCAYAKISGVEWEYIACGSGDDTVLFLAGGLFVAEHVFAHVEALEGACRLIVPSMPPLGDVDAVTDGLAAILDREGTTSAHVLGQSSGAVTAQVFVQRYPERVRKLILTGAAPLLNSQPLASALALAAEIVAHLPEGAVKALYRAMLGNAAGFPPSEAAFWKAYMNELFALRLTKAHIMGSIRQAHGAIRAYAVDRPGARPWGGEVLLIDGELARLGQASARRTLTRHYPSARVRLVAGAGHTLDAAAVARYAEAVTAFIAEPSSYSGPLLV